MDDQEIKYPIGIQSFEKIRSEGYLYIDKTRYIPRLLSNVYYFLGRPRRFGKSLFLSTLEAFFSGKKGLFDGLDVSKYEWDWKEYPIIHIDFTSMSGTNIDDLVQDLRRRLYSIAEKYNTFIHDQDLTLEGLFSVLIESLHEKMKRNVVILIDEYDKGIIDVLRDDELREKAISRLRPFFSVMKSHDRYIRFAFITGVARFRNTTIFSGFNNPEDISMDPEFASICGISKEELLLYFNDGINRIVDRYGYTKEKTVETILQKYDGYRFSMDEEYVCNPFSVINAMKKAVLDNYWVGSGTSRILADYLRESNFSIEDLTQRWVTSNQLSSPYNTSDPLSLFFQTGYLTIREYDEDAYRLRVPNQEVQSSLSELLIPIFSNLTSGDITNDLQRLRIAIRSGDINAMMEIFKTVIASVPFHHIENKTLEKHIHLCMHIICMMLGVNTRSEIAVAAGRVDMVAQTPWRVYVFEFKVDGSALQALQQIEDKGYALQWQSRGRIVSRIGVNFSSSLRTIDKWIVR